MRFCLMIEGQQGPSWDQWVAVADACERFGFEALFSSDHYFPGDGPGGRGSFDAWTVLAGLAARTERLRLGTLVSPVTFRQPAPVAKIATTVDHISRGRVEIGLGAGWWEEEHRMHGIPFPPTSERFEILEEQLEIVHGLLSSERFSLETRHYALEDVAFERKPVQRPHPPIIIGGSGGERIAGLVARWGDEFNTVGGTPEEVRERFERVRGAVRAAGRDPGSITTSFMTWFVVGPNDRAYREELERAHRAYAEPPSLEEYRRDAEHDWIVGTPERAAERLSAYAAAGVQRVMLNHVLYDDVEVLELLASEVFPVVEG